MVITDPGGDANFLNSQFGSLPMDGDKPTSVDLTVPDILAVWFSHDAKTISVHIQTEAPPPAAEAAYNFFVGVNPAGDDIAFTGDRCLYFDIYVEGPTWVGGAVAKLLSCRTGEVRGRLAITEAPDGTGITTMTVPRSADPAFADGEVLKSPVAWTVHNAGHKGSGSFVIAAIAVVDDTKPGNDYRIARR